MASKQIQIREFEGYDYHDPFAFLRSIRKFERAVSASNLDYKVRSLHTRKLRDAHERRQAALFTVGMAQRFPAYTFNFCHVEKGDYDAVVRWQKDDERNFSPVQLKEFVPEKLNTPAILEQIFRDLAKYKDSEDLTVAVFLNRRIQLDLTTLPKFEKLRIGELFLFGAASRDQSRWFLIGDILSDNCVQHTFDYPT